jgi:tricorn protease
MIIMKKQGLITFSLLILFLFPDTFAQEEARLLRTPAIHGDKIIFSYAGDLYSVSSNGGMARKLTTHNGYEVFPRFSPDGKSVAFTGQYDGNTEVFLIPAEGGVPKRLTHTATLSRDDIGDRMGPNNIVLDWTPDSKNIIFRSRKQTFNSFTGQLFLVSKEGGVSTEIPLSKGGFCSYSPDGNKLAFNWVFREFRTWKYYEGGMADDIWIYDFNSKEIDKIVENPHQDIIPMWIGDEIYFLSDRDRTMNMFVYNLKTKQIQKVTDFDEYDIKFPSKGKDYIVFENGGFIYKFDIESKTTEKLTIYIADDFAYGRNELKDAAKMIRNWQPSPNGERIVFSSRGDIFSVPAVHGITLNLTETAGVHERNAAWSPDGKYIAYISDKTGEFEIYIQTQAGTENPIQLTQNSDTYIFEFEWSPDSKKILFNDKKQRLRFVNIETKKIILVDQSDQAPWFSYDWSPDSRWITYTKDEKGMTKIRMYNIETEQSYQVTEGWYSSTNPGFSSDGKYLVFTSARDFNPIYSRTEWNHAYINMNKIYLVTLTKAAKSPFAPENNVVKIEEEKNTKNDKEKIKEPETPEANEPIKVDIDGIQNRIISLPIKASNYYNVVCIGNKVYYNESSSTGDGMSAKVYDLEKKKETDLGKNLRFRISANFKKMLVRQNGKYGIIDLPSGEVTLKETANLSDMKVYVNLKKEWAQIFDESWRHMRDFFYAPNMHGVDWKAMREKYKVLVPYVNHRSDLAYIIGEMIGELNVGHTYVNNGERPRPERIKTGLLGAKLSRHSSGYYKIDKILKGANWSNRLRSPLTEIGVNVNEGDYILAVNGKSTGNLNDIYALLLNTSERQVELTVNSSPEITGSRKTIVKPVGDESSLYYFNWVQENIKKVSEATEEKVGYIHIPDMSVYGLNEFVKHYYPQLTKKALILDVRGNGGGNVSPMIIERLMRTITYATMHTGQKEGDPNPVGTFVGPKVTLLDKYSASDGDLFPYRFQVNNLGKTIGTRSWGGVVGYSGAITCIDGGSIITPSYGPYASDGSGWIIEGTGVIPDIEIENDPAREYAGIDNQLNKAIEIILEELKHFKDTVPPIPPFPDKSGKKL